MNTHLVSPWSDTFRPMFWGGLGACLLLANHAEETLADIRVAQLRSWPIVLAADATAPERYAARELRSLFAAATGTMPQLVEATSAPDSGILIGRIAGLPMDDLGEEGFRVQITDQRIAIAGGPPRGTLYGVYSFLEDHFGVRFLTAEHTHVPRAADDLTVPRGEHVFRPRFTWRYSYYAANRQHPEFATRLRCNAVTDREELGGRVAWSVIGHSVDRYVPVAKYGAEHPDYFSLVDGRRRSFMREDHFEAGGTQPCFSHPDVRRLIIDGVRHELSRDRKTAGNIAIGQNDNQMYCRCERCQAVDEHEHSHMGALLSLVNEVAAAVEQDAPRVFVGTLAYQYSRTPPRHLRPRNNVGIQLCSIEACLLHALDDPECAQNAAFCKDLAGWCAICNHVYVWNYNVNFANYVAPCPNLLAIGPNVRYLASQGVRGVFMQAAGDGRNTELCDLRNYVIARLLWDPTADDRQLVDEFVQLHYGRAAGKVREYLELIHRAARTSGLHRACYGTAADYGIDAAVARQALEILQQGMELADDDVVRRRVEKVAIAPRTALLDPFARWVGRHYREIRAGTIRAAEPEAYQGLEEPLRAAFALYERHDVDRLAEFFTVAELKALLPPAIFADQ